MPEHIAPGEMLLDAEEDALFARQIKAQQSADTWKWEADYQNEPKGDQQCSNCAMFVPGLAGDVGGYCTKVCSVRGDTGMIFYDGWCKFWEPDDERTAE